ncbi:nuclear transport factor 2 family protein [Denitratisoma oestradiolicum]|uniref:SnoaL-like domain-containing protein n=1 Tax=Denitratisoma oestradiolicum TaxID=311182 RepID=A0A6S6XSH6_9PROT|nr:nuclear transport factor 2 family protein [Denitratisoma oestradiolicum]CAB1367660.1 conserved protein of unknown function [Denitratisoma oestradiolicum]
MPHEDLIQLHRDIRRLQDIEEIQRLKHAYFRCDDTANFEEMATLLHEDFEVNFVGGTYEWRLQGKAAFMEMTRKSFTADVVAQHHGHTPEITVLSETEASGIWYLHDNFWNLKSKRYTHGTALYRDRYVKENGRWLLRASAYERIYEIVEPLVTPPNFTVRYLAKRFG